MRFSNKKTVKVLMIWTAFHCFALLMSYSNVPAFNTSKSPDTSSFWPFVEFDSCSRKFYESDASKRKAGPAPGSFRILEGEYKTECEFQGILYEYDWSEFLFYVGGAFFLFAFAKVSNND